MINKINIVLLFIILIAIYGCQKNNINDIQKFSNQQQYQDSNIISISLITDIAMHISDQYLLNDDTTQRITNRNIDSIYTISDKNNLPGIYIINYANNSG